MSTHFPSLRAISAYSIAQKVQNNEILSPNNNEEILPNALYQYIQPFIKTASSNNPMITAAQNSLDSVKCLFAFQKSITKDTHVLDEAFIKAAANGHLDVILFLIDNCPDFHFSDIWALERAAEGGHLEVIRFLFQNTAENQDKYLDNIVQIAASYGHFEVIQFLFATADVTNKTLIKGVRGATANGGHLEILRFLFETATKMKSHVLESEDCVLQMAWCEAARGHLDVFKFLLKNGVYSLYPYAMNDAANLAAFYGNIDVVKFIFENVSGKALDLKNVLRTAASYDHLAIVIFLTKKGINPPPRNDAEFWRDLKIYHLRVYDFFLKTIQMRR
jgi:ankyrin repeat protein